MRISVLALPLACTLHWAAPAMAQGAMVSLQTGVDAAGWEAVGRLDIAGKGFCTATLIAPTRVLTAAHCVFDRDSGTLIAPERFEFLAGLRNGRALAYRAIRRVVVHPDYDPEALDRAEMARWDLAVLELQQPIRTAEIAPLAVARAVTPGAEVGVVSYAHDRALAPSLQEMCDVVAGEAGVLVFSCDVDFGSSGAPVFQAQGGLVEVVSVISAKAELEGSRVSVGMELEQPLAEVLDLLSDISFAATAPGAVRVIRPGERTETGARFVTVGEGGGTLAID